MTLELTANRFLETQTTKAARSQYGKGKQEEPKGQKPDQHEKCHFCGQRGHGKRAPPITPQNNLLSVQGNLWSLWSAKPFRHCLSAQRVNETQRD